VRAVTVEVVCEGIVVANSIYVLEAVSLSQMSYWVRLAPPFEAGAVQERETWALPGVAERYWGGVGAVATWTLVVAVLVPFAFVAVRV
jgi:hypothetical protein